MNFPKSCQSPNNAPQASHPKDLENKVTPDLEDDWMEWKGAIEMKELWNEALKEVLDSKVSV